MLWVVDSPPAFSTNDLINDMLDFVILEEGFLRLIRYDETH